MERLLWRRTAAAQGLPQDGRAARRITIRLAMQLPELAEGCHQALGEGGTWALYPRKAQALENYAALKKPPLVTVSGN